MALVDGINALFPDVEALGNAGEIGNLLLHRHLNVTENVGELLDELVSTKTDADRTLHDIRYEFAVLEQDVRNVQDRTLLTESTMMSMTSEIKRLDATKRNITQSMTMLKRLQMLTSGFEQIQQCSDNKQYHGLSHLLQAVIQLQGHFKSYRSVDQIAWLSKNISELLHRLGNQIYNDFQAAFSVSTNGSLGPLNEDQTLDLIDAAAVADALGEQYRDRIINWYCNCQMREYTNIFRRDDEAGSLDNIGRRYAWLKRLLLQYAQDHSTAFPQIWKVDEKMILLFCKLTKEDFGQLLAAKGQKLDVDLLLTALQQTLNFEQYLDRRIFGGDRLSTDSTISKDYQTSPYGRLLSDAFEPYLGFYIEFQDQVMARKLQTFKHKSSVPETTEEYQQNILPSSVELFLLYRQILAQCAKLSTGLPLLDLSRLYAKWLVNYAEVILNRVLQSDPRNLIDRACQVLNTADYCMSTIPSLEEKLRDRLDEDLKKEVTLDNGREAFVAQANIAIKRLVESVKSEYEMSLREMSNTNWTAIESVEDQSDYVTQLCAAICFQTRGIFKNIEKEKYAFIVCNRVADATINDFFETMIKCRPISELGAEQLLLDLEHIRTCLTGLTKLRAGRENIQAPQSFIRAVNRMVARPETILKLIMHSSSPIDALIQGYMLLVKDKNSTNFSVILELKGIPKSDHPSYLQKFGELVSNREDLLEQSPLITPIQLPQMVTQTASPRYEGLMTTGRASFERILQSGTTSPVAEPATSTIKLNENLRNFGRMFRRDVGNRLRNASRETPLSPPGGQQTKPNI